MILHFPCILLYDDEEIVSCECMEHSGTYSFSLFACILPESTLGGIRESLSLGMFRRTKFALMKRVFKEEKKNLAKKKGGLGSFQIL